MQKIERRAIRCEGVMPFEFQISEVLTDRTVKNEGDGSHVHPECEIYINLSGDVSFMVEKQIYPITAGSIVITRPYEYHHCMYHSDAPHRHFWILFSPTGNERLLGRFLDRESGEGNLLTLSSECFAELTELCHDLTERAGDALEEQYRFLRILHFLEDAIVSDVHTTAYPQDVLLSLERINRDFFLPLRVEELAKEAHVSVNTLERHFAASLGLSPTGYLKKKRLAHAAALLYEGRTVLEACEESGFSDCSGFIAEFKRAYGMTPLKYKLQVSGKRK